VETALLALFVVNLRWNDWAATPGLRVHTHGWSLAAADAMVVAVFGTLLVVFTFRARRAARTR